MEGKKAPIKRKIPRKLSAFALHFSIGAGDVTIRRACEQVEEDFQRFAPAERGHLSLVRVSPTGLHLREFICGECGGGEREDTDERAGSAVIRGKGRRRRGHGDRRVEGPLLATPLGHVVVRYSTLKEMGRRDDFPSPVSGARSSGCSRRSPCLTGEGECADSLDCGFDLICAPLSCADDFGAFDCCLSKEEVSLKLRVSFFVLLTRFPLQINSRRARFKLTNRLS